MRMQLSALRILAVLLLVGAPSLGLATGDTSSGGPDAEGEFTFTEENGLYTAVKSFQVFSDTNPGNPSPVPGHFTYVYTLANSPGSLISLIGYDLEVPADSVADAGFLDGGGVEPSAVLVGSQVVEFDFASGIPPGQTSEQLFIVSIFSPGVTDDNTAGENDASVGGEFGFDTPGKCTGPKVIPTPFPCHTLFWKLLILKSWFLKHHFPGDHLIAIKERAAELSMGIFPDKWALVDGLFTGWWVTVEERAESELATLLLNLAAAELFPGNTKCRLFPQTALDFDGDGMADSDIGTELVTIKANVQSGDPALQKEAAELADAITDGDIVIDGTLMD